MSGANIFLWLAAPAMLLVGLILGLISTRSRSKVLVEVVEVPLDSDEKSKLEKILNS